MGKKINQKRRLDPLVEKRWFPSRSWIQLEMEHLEMARMNLMVKQSRCIQEMMRSLNPIMGNHHLAVLQVQLQGGESTGLHNQGGQGGRDQTDPRVGILVTFQARAIVHRMRPR